MREFFVEKSNCVYFLFNDEGAILYVGSTVCLHARIGQHLQQDKIPFTIVRYKTYSDVKSMCMSENYYIKKLKPKFNVKLDERNYTGRQSQKKKKTDKHVFQYRLV